MPQDLLNQLDNYEIVPEGILVVDMPLWAIQDIVGDDYELDTESDYEGVLILES
jgi:hypothetical protein